MCSSDLPWSATRRRWAAVVPLGLGLLIGGRIGPTVVRRAPVRPLQVIIAILALLLAARLAWTAYW